MSSPNENFKELMERIRHGRELGHAGFEPVYYLVFGPHQILEVKRNMPAWVLSEQKELHDWMLSTFGAENLFVAFTPNTISYKPLVNGKRGKVILYSGAQKRGGVRLYIPHNETKPFYKEVRDDSGPSAEFQEWMRTSYTTLQR